MSYRVLLELMPTNLVPEKGNSFSQFWRPEIQNQSVGKTAPWRSSGRFHFLLFPRVAYVISIYISILPYLLTICFLKGMLTGLGLHKTTQDDFIPKSHAKILSKVIFFNKVSLQKVQHRTINYNSVNCRHLVFS